MRILAIDLESKSLAKIKEVGAWAYSRHPTTEVMCICATDVETDESVIIDFRKKIKPRVLERVNSYDCFLAHNYCFEQAMFENILMWHGFKLPRLWLDSMDICAYMGVPLGLAKAAEFLFNDEQAIQKDKAGTKIMQKLCTPYKGKIREGSEEEWQGLLDYCLQDSEVSKQIYLHCKPFIHHSEFTVMMETHDMNRRGIPFDKDLVDKLMKLYQEAVDEVDVTKYGLTTKDLNRNTWLPEFFADALGFHIPNMQAPTIEKVLNDPATPEKVIDILKARMVTSAASIKKLKKAVGWSGGESYIRNGFQYHGAKTGRFAGRGVQPQNLPRGFSKDEDIYKTLEMLNARYI